MEKLPGEGRMSMYASFQEGVSRGAAFWLSSDKPKHSSAYLASELITLELVPLEILHLITDYLPLVEQAVLALTSKTLRLKLRSQILVEVSREPATRFELLLLLEKDWYNFKQILCAVCKVFHPPQSSLLSYTTTHGPFTRPCVEVQAKQNERRMTSPYLPPQLHFNMIKAVMQSYHHGTGLYSPDLLTGRQLFYNRKNEAQIQYTTRCVTARGRLVVRTAITLRPSASKSKSKSAAPYLIGVMQAFKTLNQICGHFSWSEVFPFIFNPTWGSYFNLFRRLREPFRRDEDVWNPNLTAGLSDIHTCSICGTDFLFDWKDLPQNGNRVVSLSSYKDIGAGKDMADKSWKAHLWERNPTILQVSDSMISKFSAYAAFVFVEERKKTLGYGSYDFDLEPWCFDMLSD